jgi:hypothetical protein
MVILEESDIKCREVLQLWSDKTILGVICRFKFGDTSTRAHNLVVQLIHKSIVTMPPSLNEEKNAYKKFSTKTPRL